MKAKFTGDGERYGLKVNESFDINFRSEGQAIFVEVTSLKGLPLGTYVFPNIESFLDSWRFAGVTKSNRIRKFTDLNTATYFSVGEAAEYFGVSIATINRWAKIGKLDVHHTVSDRGDKRFLRVDCQKLYEGMGSGQF